MTLMRIRTMAVVVAMGNAVITPVLHGASMSYVLYDGERNQACLYQVESEWNTDVGEWHPMVTAVVSHSAGHLHSVIVTEHDETGDWTVRDKYVVASDGRFERLERTVTIIPGERVEQLTFELRLNSVIKRQHTRSGLRPGASPITKETWLPDVAIARRVQDLPFGALLRPEVLGGAVRKTCVPDAGRRQR